MTAEGVPPQTLESDQGVLCVDQNEGLGSDSMSIQIHSGTPQGCVFSKSFSNYIIDWILEQAPQDYAGVQAGSIVMCPLVIGKKAKREHKPLYV